VSIESERLADQLGALRRVALPELLLQVAHGFGALDLSVIQVATLYLLDLPDAASAPTVRVLADLIGRSVSATSRLVNQLVVGGLVDRRADTADRRARRLGLTAQGKRVLREFESTRASAQLKITRYLSDDEQRAVAEAIELLALAAKRQRNRERPRSHGRVG
jgi:DNA-binding MarR family transcriptional regulator